MDKENVAFNQDSDPCHNNRISQLLTQQQPQISWEEFVTLLTENHNSAFELTTLVMLCDHELLTPPQSSHEQAKALSLAVREAAGYWFK